jgi:hypothetical protein
MKHLVLGFSVWFLSLLLPLASWAQDSSIGDVARAARADKSQAPHASKVVTDEDIGPQVGPVAETDDPAEVVNKAVASFQKDMQHTCREEFTNNSGPGSSTESIKDVAGPDRMRMVVDRRGANAGHTEFIIIGQDTYLRTGSAPWMKSATPGAMPPNVLPEALWNHYQSGELRLTGRQAVGGAIVFVYGTKYHPGGVGNRDRSIEIWVGVKDGLLRRVQMVTSEATASFIPPTVERDTMTCSYAQVPEIKPPM